MLDLRLKLYNSINIKLENTPDFFYLDEKSSLNYESILKIWSDFICKEYSDLFSTINDDKIFEENNSIHQNVVNLCKNNLDLAIIFEDLFKYHVRSKEDDLMIFYIKGSDRALLKLKSYTSIVYHKSKVLPFWNLYIKQDDFVKSLDNYMEEYPDNTLCILCF